ncbi:MAG: conserved repeat domain [Solirubrobacteraceae bacterium]|nr:conserved repeat domain [Solirubrobacteraceae bacterium]
MPRRIAFLALIVTALCFAAAPAAFAAGPDVAITNVGSPDPVAAGQYVSEQIGVKNLGGANANSVTVTDPLPTGTQFVSATYGCSYAGNLVTCPIGSMPPGGSYDIEIVLRLTNFSLSGLINNTASVTTSSSDTNHANNSAIDVMHVIDYSHDHHITPYEVSADWDFDAGQTQTRTLNCNAGDHMTDGSMRVDNIDQGTGNLSSLTLTEEQSVNPGTGYEFTATNFASGRAQAKLFGACMPKRTEDANSDHGVNHHHTIPFEPIQTSAATALPGGGASTTVVVHCNSPAFVSPAAPGYVLNGGAQADLVRSEPDNTAGPGWAMTFISSQPGTVTTNLRCLDRFIGTTLSHTHELWLSHPDTVVTVPPNYPAGGEFVISCSDEAKGIVASFNMPTGVTLVGDEPQIKSRVFKIVNTTGVNQSVHLDLLCVGDRTGTDPPPPVVPTAIAATATPAASGATVPVAMTCPTNGCSGTVQLTGAAGGSRAVTASSRVIGKAYFASYAKGRHVVRVPIAKAYRSAIRSGKLRTVTVLVKTGAKAAKHRTLRLRH